MKSLTVVTKSLLATLIIVLLAGVWVTPTAAAEPPERDYPRLEYGLKLALIRADALQGKIDTASAAADVAAEFIADKQDIGFDTGDLEVALNTFRTQIGKAQTLHDSAAQILADKAGFNSDGQVVDLRQARDTLKKPIAPCRMPAKRGLSPVKISGRQCATISKASGMASR